MTDVVQAVCGVSPERATQLLQAATGDVQRAVEIHLSEQQREAATPPSPGSSTAAAGRAAGGAGAGDAPRQAAKRNRRDTSASAGARRAGGSPAASAAASPPRRPTRSGSSTGATARDEAGDGRKRRRTARDASPASSAASQPSPSRQATLAAFFGRSPHRQLVHRDDTSPQKTGLPKVEGLAASGAASAGSMRNDAAECNSGVVEEGRRASAAAASAGAAADARPDTAVVSPTKSTSKGPPGRADDERFQFISLARTFAAIAATSKRTEKTTLLCSLFRNLVEAVGGVGGDDASRAADCTVVSAALRLVLGLSDRLQLSDAAVSRAIQQVTGVSAARLREAYRATGDLGDAAARFTRSQRLLVTPAPLTIMGVHDALGRIAEEKGEGSDQRRRGQVVRLLRSCRNEETQFLVRILLGNMRLHAGAKTVFGAFCRVVEELRVGHPQKGVDGAMYDQFCECPSVERLVRALLVGGVPYMRQTCGFVLGQPTQPMLADAAHSFDEVRDLAARAGSVAVEWKYDGIRCIAHGVEDGKSARLFSRQLQDVTSQFPDAASALLAARNPSVASFAVDAELVGVEHVTSSDGVAEVRMVPFQQMSTRLGATEAARTSSVAVRFFAFDLLYLNGRSLTKKPLAIRQELLRSSFHETRGFAFAASMNLTSYDEDALKTFLQEAVDGGAEGLMVKVRGATDGKNEAGRRATDVKAIAAGGAGAAAGAPGPDAAAPDRVADSSIAAVYEHGKRSKGWLKLKRDYVSGFSETIDVVPIGAWHGSGRKATKNFWSPVLLAVYDPDGDVFRSVARCMSFTDAMYTATREHYTMGTEYPAGVGVEEASGAPVSGDPGSDEEADGSQPAPVGEEAATWRHAWLARERGPPHQVVTSQTPSIWFSPREVWEVAFADLSLSTAHSAAEGLVAGSARGVALRFPRFKRRRPDKRPTDATTAQQLAEMYAKQAKVRS